MCRLAGAVGSQATGSEPTHVPWPDLVRGVIGFGEFVGEGNVLGIPERSYT